MGMSYVFSLSSLSLLMAVLSCVWVVAAALDDGRMMAVVVKKSKRSAAAARTVTRRPMKMIMMMMMRRRSGVMYCYQFFEEHCLIVEWLDLQSKI